MAAARRSQQDAVTQQPTFRQRLGWWSLVLTGPMLIATGLEAIGASVGNDAGIVGGVHAVTYILALFAPPVLVVAVAAALLLAPRSLQPATFPVRQAAGWLGAGGLALAIVYSANLWARNQFANVELSSLLAALIAALTFIGALGIVRAFNRWTATVDAPRNISTGAAGLAGLLAIAWVVRDNAAGFSQLSGWLLAMPCALLAMPIIAYLLGNRRPTVGAVVLAGLTALGVGSFAATELSDSPLPSELSDYGPLLQWVGPRIQAVSDVDGDGVGFLLGGEDCAPFDAAIAPGLYDKPGDGIDNNCLGGDATTSVEGTAPTWHPMPDDWDDFSVLLVTVETLRADHVGFMGYDRPTTPRLDALAQTSTVFENFYATSTYTRLALPGILSSRYPSRLDLREQKRSKFPRLHDSNPWLPLSLQRADFDTGAIVADFPAFTEKDHIGFDRGFDDYDASAPLKYRGGTMRGFSSTRQLKSAYAWLDKRKRDRFFLWIHLFEPHYLYEQFPNAPKFGDDRIDKYDSEIWGADQAIGRLVDHLQKIDRRDDTIIVVTGDHGEEFGEHGKRYHGSNVYEPQVRTPLLIHVPGQRPRRVATASSFADIAPTILNLGNVRTGFDEYSGRNLTPLFFDRPIDDAPIFLETWKVLTRRRYKVGVVHWPYKLVATGRSAKERELYHLVDDPGESKNLIDEQRDVATSMEALLEAYLENTALRYGKPDDE